MDNGEAMWLTDLHSVDIACGRIWSGAESAENLGFRPVLLEVWIGKCNFVFSNSAWKLKTSRLAFSEFLFFDLLEEVVLRLELVLLLLELLLRLMALLWVQWINDNVVNAYCAVAAADCRRLAADVVSDGGGQWNDPVHQGQKSRVS
jgi:hypothetical protein